jgi:DNA polymerase III subunit epsilon
MNLYDFVALDFETATHRYNSACSIGIAAVKGGEIIDTFYSLLQPPGMEFEKDTIRIHGITPDMVKDAPTLDQIWLDISKFFGPHLVVAHNARFDMMVLKNSLEWFRADDFHYVDSMSIAKQFVPGSKSLENCAHHFQIDMGCHHNALDDAIVCAKILQNCLKESSAENIGQLCFSQSNVKIHQFSELSDSKSESYSRRKASATAWTRIPVVKASDITPRSESFCCDHPLYQKSIVFTGELSIDRAAAMQMAVDVGGIVKSSVSRKTDYLVVGTQDLTLVGEDGMSSKEEKAYALNQAGKAHIQIICEQDFISLVHAVEV